MRRSGRHFRPGTTRGKPASRDVVAARVAFIEAAYLACGGSVVETARRAKAELGVSRATVARHLAVIRRGWVERTNEDREAHRAEARARILADQAKARELGRWSVVLGYERLLAEVDALLVERSEVLTAHVTDPLAPLAGLPAAQKLAALRFVRDRGRLPTDDELAGLAGVPALPAKSNGHE